MKQITIYMIFVISINVAQVARAQDIDEPVNCKISGSATTIDRQFGAGPLVIGDIAGTASNGYGSWFHGFGNPESFFLLSPDNVTCRQDGILIGDSRGTVSDVTSDYRDASRYVLQVEDQDPQLHWFTVQIEASRDASQEGIVWQDGSLERLVILTVPEELPVTEGSAGNQWATLEFVPTETGAEVSCRYRGTGDTALEPSDRYVLDACVGAGRTLVGGEEIEVEQIGLHLVGSAPGALTSVSLPARVGKMVSDFYVLLIENDAGEVIYSFYGFVDPESGDLAVEDF